MGVKKERPKPGRRTLRALVRGGRTAGATSSRRGKNLGLFRDPRIKSRSSAGSPPETESSRSQERLGGLPLRPSGPVQFALKLTDFWHLSHEDFARLLGFGLGDTTYAAAVLSGRTELHGRDVRDRIAHLFRIRESLHSLFRDLEVENAWLREPHELLEGKSPMSLMVGGSMEDLLLVREYVDEDCG